MDEAIKMKELDHVALEQMDELHRLAYQIGRIGHVPTKEETLRFMELLGGPGEKVTPFETVFKLQELISAAPPVEVPFPPIPIGWHIPMEAPIIQRAAELAQAYYYSYGGENIGLLDRSQYKKRFDPRLRANSKFDVATDDLDLIRDYFRRQDNQYVQELEQLINPLTPMKPETKLVITVPAYHEGANIKHTLEQYAKMKNPERFEIVIFENHPAAKGRDNTLQEVEAFKTSHPNINIHLFHKAFDQKAPIGNIRKYLVDAVVLRKEKTGIKDSIVITSNDADLININPDYSNILIQKFDQDKNLDAVGVKWDYPSEAFKQMPLLHAAQRLWQFFDISFRNSYLKSPDLIGRNSAFRSGIYTAVGGYNDQAQLAEDLEIGWLIKNARGYDPQRISYVNSAWLISNPRRAVVKLVSGVPLIQQYGDFHVNEDVRRASLDELFEKKKDLNMDEFIQNVQAIYDHYGRWRKSLGGWLDDGYFIKSFDRAMGYLGAKYHVENDKIIIDDISRLEQGLARYKTPAMP